MNTIAEHKQTKKSNKMNIHQTLGKHILADGMNIVLDLEKSHGNWVVDEITGEKYLDLFTMFASTSIGYNHPHLVNQIEFLGKMAIQKPTLSDVYTKEYADFMETFSRVAMPEYLQYAFFVEGGTLAVENALKAAFDWKTRKNFIDGHNEEADIVIHFKESFHGRSGYTLSLTNTSDPRKHMYFPKFDWPRIINPKLHFPIDKENLEETIEKEHHAKEQIETSFKKYGNRVACIIVETLQGEGGDNYFRKEFHEYLREITEKNDAFLIYDEVQCGLGITGKMWAHEHYGVKPDIMTFGKKSQVCGILANKEKLDQIPNNVFKESSRLNSTFGGNFIDFIRFKMILEVYEQENLVENAKVQGEYLLNKLHQLQAKHHDLISNVRGLGLWCAFDFPNPEIRAAFLKESFKNKTILLPCGDYSIRFRPHLTITSELIDEAIERIDTSLNAVI